MLHHRWEDVITRGDLRSWVDPGGTAGLSRGLRLTPRKKVFGVRFLGLGSGLGFDFCLWLLLGRDLFFRACLVYHLGFSLWWGL